MESFKDLYIDTDEPHMAILIDEVSKIIKKPWSRAKDKEEDTGFGETVYCFEREKDALLPGAGLIIFEKENGRWYVPNVVPTETGQLTRKEYNQILSDFYDNFLLIVSKTLGIETSLSTGVLEDEDVVGNEAAALLKSFSNCANKSTGSSHPSDQKRWFKFIVSACKSKKYIETDNLQRLLQKQGWSESKAYELASEFEFARDLIDFIERDE